MAVLYRIIVNLKSLVVKNIWRIIDKTYKAHIKQAATEATLRLQEQKHEHV